MGIPHTVWPIILFTILFIIRFIIVYLLMLPCENHHRRRLLLPSPRYRLFSGVVDFENDALMATALSMLPNKLIPFSFLSPKSNILIVAAATCGYKLYNSKPPWWFGNLKFDDKLFVSMVIAFEADRTPRFWMASRDDADSSSLLHRFNVNELIAT